MDRTSLSCAWLGAPHKQIYDQGCILVYSIVFYCIILYSMVFYGILLYSIVCYCILLYCSVFYCILLYSIVFYCVLLYSFVFYGILLYSNEAGVGRVVCMYVPIYGPQNANVHGPMYAWAQ